MQRRDDDPASGKTEPYGLAIMRAKAESGPSPMMATMNFTLDEVEEGRAVFRGTPTPNHFNSSGVIHGGWAATVLDSALGCVVATTLGEGESYTTVEFKVNLIRPITGETGQLTCTGTLLSRGRRIATAEARLVDGNGKLVAFGTETCIILTA